MRISLYLEKSIEENAGLYYERAKKLKKKIEGAKSALSVQLKKLESIEKSKPIKKKDIKKTKREKHWYEKFHWFISSDGFLVIGGRDATTNEIVIKKHTEKNDLVFHTDMAGSPFFVIKADNKKIGEATKKETADATVSYSRAWKLGLYTTPVFYVEPEQVSKKARAGEYLTKGAFMIYGKTNYIDNKINLAIGVTKDGIIMGGPKQAIKANCVKYAIIQQGQEKPSSVAKKIRYILQAEDLDEIIRALPSGGCKIIKE